MAQGLDLFAWADARAAADRWDAIAWLDRAFYLASWDRWRAASETYRRFDKHGRELTLERARQLSNPEIDRILPVLEHAKFNGLCGQRRVWTRPEIGALIVEVRNRRTLLELGRECRRDRGPRLDPARMPLEAIERLIQRHNDMAVVEQLRAERNRRMACQ